MCNLNNNTHDNKILLNKRNKNTKGKPDQINGVMSGQARHTNNNNNNNNNDKNITDSDRKKETPSPS